MFDRFQDDSRQSMGHARLAAQRFQHDYIDTEHVLLGLLELDECDAAQILRTLGASLTAIRAETENRMKVGPSMVTQGQIPFTADAKRVLELTLEETHKLGHAQIGTGHLLLGLIAQRDGIAAGALRASGVEANAVRDRVRELAPTAGAEGTAVRPEPTVNQLAAETRELREENLALQARVADLEARVRALEEER